MTACAYTKAPITKITQMYILCLFVEKLHKQYIFTIEKRPTKNKDIRRPKIFHCFLVSIKVVFSLSKIGEQWKVMYTKVFLSQQLSSKKLPTGH